MSDENYDNLPHSGEHQPAVNAPGPTSDDNGYIVVPNASMHAQSQAIENQVESVVDALTKSKELSSAESALNRMVNTVVAEADSSTTAVPHAPSKPAHSEHHASAAAKGCPVSKKDGGASCSMSACSLCPYYLLGCEYLSKVQIPPKVKDLVLWKNPKLTGIVFATSLVLLLSLACFSLLTVIGSLSILALSAVGAYRFYLALMFRIKGTPDDTFEKLSKCDLSLPKEKFQEFSRLIETDANRFLNKLKSIILWDNITTSALAFFVCYLIYCVGSWFNTLTLLIILLVDIFTLPKIYEVYKVQIDDCIQKATTCVHGVVKQVMVKLPFLNKKKTQ